MSSYVYWNLATEPSKGNVTHFGGQSWKASPDSFTMSLYNVNGSPQTLWFNSLRNLVVSSPVVYLNAFSNIGVNNWAQYLVKSVNIGSTTTTINVSFVRSADQPIGEAAQLGFSYYSNSI
jgi:hypothetical protein